MPRATSARREFLPTNDFVGPLLFIDSVLADYDENNALMILQILKTAI